MAALLVGIVGAKALRRDINRLTDDIKSPLYKAMAQAGYEAVQPIVARTRSATRTGSGPRASGTRLEGTVRASRTRTGGAVRMGRANVPYAGWVEFGGVRHSPHESTREYRPGGRYLFPAARDLSARAATLYAQGLQRAFDSYHWTNEGANAHD